MTTVFWSCDSVRFTDQKQYLIISTKIARWCHQSISFVMGRHWSKFRDHKISIALEATALAF